MTHPHTAPPRTYGGWRRARGFGIFGLGFNETVIVLVGAFAILFIALISASVGLVLGFLFAFVVAAMLIRVGGVPIAQLVLGRIRWWVGAWRNWHTWRGGVITDHPRAFALPGVLAPLALLSAEDGSGGHYGLILDRSTGTLTATLNVIPVSTWLADRDEVDTWVANWGQWLASLGHQPMLTHLAVTVETAPDAGTTLRDTLQARRSSDAPAAAVEIIETLISTSPAAAADVHTRVSLTFDPARAPIKLANVADAAAEIGRVLTGLEVSLAGCGLTVPSQSGRASAPELAGAIRVAFDPAARGDVDHVLAAGENHAENLLTLADAGPVSAVEHLDHYQHDSGWSVSFAWHEAPRHEVSSTVLAPLITPGAFPKRVTLLYRPYSAAQAARMVQAERSGAQFRERLAAHQGKDATARDITDRHYTDQQAFEEAAGAGLVRLSVWVTTTVTDPAHLPSATAQVTAASDNAKLRLRRLNRSQAVGFATTLPAGICPPTLANRFPH